MKLRKIMALLLCGAMALSLAACGSKDENGGQGDAPQNGASQNESNENSTPAPAEKVELNIGSSGTFFVSSLEASGVDAIASVPS